MKVLIIEDNLATAKFYQALLNKEKIENEVLLYGKNALETIINNKFDLILLDLELPDVSGFKILQDIRKKFDANELPILVVSGIYNENLITEVLEIGANEFINKPFKNDYFKEKILLLLNPDMSNNEVDVS